MQLMRKPTLPYDTSLKLQHGHYLLRPASREVVIPGLEDDERKLPILLFSSATDVVDEETILGNVHHFQASDDVFSLDFLSAIVAVQCFSSTTIDVVSTDKAPTKKLKPVHLGKLRSQLSWDVKQVFDVPVFEDGTVLPSGPYFLYRGRLFEAWKLYADELASFQTTVVPDYQDPYKFHPLDAVSSDGYWKAVAVPSRLYRLPSQSKPLAGCRIAVKDLFRLAGINTALNVRAFLESHDPETLTADYVKILIDLGAIIVGKTKMTAFAGGERAPEFWIDFHCPFNPRADGYQTPSGSTSGGAACLAGYKWLDYSLGSDTYGSIRWPAAACGLYGLRCTVDQAASMKGIYAQVPQFVRHSRLDVTRPYRPSYPFKIISQLYYSRHFQGTKFPKRILCPTDWRKDFSPFHNEVVDKLVSALESFIGVSRTNICLEAEWQKDPHALAKGKSFQEFFHKTGYNIFYYDAYHEWDQFRADYQQSFGKKPYVGPHVTYLWGLGAGISSAERAEATRELEVYREWVEDTVFSNDTESDLSSVVVLPVLSTKPDYRDVLSPPFSARLGVDTVTFGSWLGVPELVLPINKVPYHSKITDRTEYLPVSVSILGPKGSELMLINLALAALSKAGFPTSLAAGRDVFEDAC